MPPRTAAPPWRQASCLTCQNAPPPGRPEAVTMAPPLVPSPTTADADSRAPFPRRADVPVRSHAQSARRSQTVHALFHGPPPPPEPGSGTGILPVRWRRQTRAGLTPNGRLTGQAGRLSHYGVGAPSGSGVQCANCVSGNSPTAPSPAGEEGGVSPGEGAVGQVCGPDARPMWEVEAPHGPVLRVPPRILETGPSPGLFGRRGCPAPKPVTGPS